MKLQKRKKAELLYSSMTELDDYLLQEALVYRAAQKRTSRAWIAAAGLAASFVLVFGSVMLGNLVHLESEVEDAPVKDAARPISLDAYLLEQGEAAAYATLSAEEVDLFSAPTVVWQFAGDDTLCQSRPLKSGEWERLTESISDGTHVGAASPAQACRVWLLDGNGNVITPYLLPSSGNIGMTLFDYEAELIPSSSFVSCLEEILGTP